MITNSLRTVVRSLARSAAVLAGSLFFSTHAFSVDLGPPGAGICFSSTFSGDTFVVLDSSGNVGVVAPSREAEIEADGDTDGFANAVFRVAVELLDDTGARIWRRSGFTLRSNEVVLSNPIIDELVPATLPQGIPSRHLRYYPVPVVCEGFGIVESGGTRYLFVATGVAGMDADTGLQDETIAKVWIVNLNNGNIVQTHRIIPQGGKFALLLSSGIFDIDNDGNDELVVLRSSNLGDIGNRTRFRITVEVYNIVTGNLERDFNTIVNDEFSNANAMP